MLTKLLGLSGSKNTPTKVFSLRSKLKDKKKKSTCIALKYSSQRTEGKTLKTESAYINNESIRLQTTISNSQSQLSIIEKSYRKSKHHHLSSNRTTSMFKSEMENAGLIFHNPTSYHGRQFDREIFTLDNYKEIRDIIDNELDNINRASKDTLKLNLNKENQASHLLENDFVLVPKPNVKVQEMIYKLYHSMFSELFTIISIIPDLIDRRHIKLSGLPIITVCFLKGIVEGLLLTNISLKRDEFISICFLVYNKMTLKERKKFLEINKLK